MAVEYAREEDVAVVTVDDGKVNAYTSQLLRELSEALQRAESETSAMVLMGRPGRFSAGFDLAELRRGDVATREVVAAGARVLLRLFAGPLPVVAACTGHAMGFGALLLLVADRRIGVDGDFRVGLNEVAVGMPLPRFATELARYRMPPSKVESILFGETVGPDEALSYGYLDTVVPSGVLRSEAIGTAGRLARLPQHAVAETKVALRGGVLASIRSTIDGDLSQLVAPS